MQSIFQESVATSCKSFQNAFSSHVKSVEKTNLSKAPDKRQKARAASKVLGEAAILINDFVKKTLETDFPCLVPDLACDLSHCGVQAGSITAAAEKAWLGSLRIGISGTRSILAMSVSEMQKLIGPKSPEAYWDYLLHPGKDGHDEKKMVSQMFSATVGQHDVLWLPAGWIFAESVMEDVDFHGLMYRGLIQKNDGAFNELQLVRKLLTAENKQDADLSAAVAHVSKLQNDQLAEKAQAAREKAVENARPLQGAQDETPTPCRSPDEKKAERDKDNEEVEEEQNSAEKPKSEDESETQTAPPAGNVSS